MYYENDTCIISYVHSIRSLCFKIKCDYFFKINQISSISHRYINIYFYKYIILVIGIITKNMYRYIFLITIGKVLKCQYTIFISYRFTLLILFIFFLYKSRYFLNYFTLFIMNLYYA
jgi:hypothetical protein